MTALFTNRGARFGMVALVALLGYGFLGTPQASADLLLNIYTGTASTMPGSSSLVAITPTTASITCSMWFTITNPTGGNFGDPADNGGIGTGDGVARFAFGVASSNAGSTTSNPVGLTHVDIGTMTKVTGVWPAAGNGANVVPASNDYDADGDTDKTGSDTTTLAPPWGNMNWGTYSPVYPPGSVDGDGNDISGNPILDANGQPQTLLNQSPSTQMRIGQFTASLTAYNSGKQTLGHGITQIFAIPDADLFATTFVEGGISYNGSANIHTGNKITLYQTAAAHNTTGALSLNTTNTAATLVGSTSVGTMDHWAWYLRPVGDANPSDWVKVGDVNTDTMQLTVAALQAMNGGAGLAFGNYNVELVTTYISADDPNGDAAVTLPGNNSSTDSSDAAVLSYTPEPGTILFLMAGSAGLAMFRRRRSRK